MHWQDSCQQIQGIVRMGFSVQALQIHQQGIVPISGSLKRDLHKRGQRLKADNCSKDAHRITDGNGSVSVDIHHRHGINPREFGEISLQANNSSQD